MSADNFVGVRPTEDGKYEIFEYGNMSCYGDDCMYDANATPTKIVDTREEALIAAHDLVNEMDICEYGVIEMSPVPKKFCGRCYICVHERHIASDDLEKCDMCNNPISEGEWTTSWFDGVANKIMHTHSHCERQLRYEDSSLT